MQTIMKSWMSMRACACAPPPKIWICGTGSATRVSPASFFHSGFFSAAASACAQASETATMALAPRWLLSGVPSSESRRASIAAWSPDLSARRPSRMRVLMFSTAFAASIAFASPEPVEAPAGAIARPGGERRRAAADDYLGLDRCAAARVPDLAAPYVEDLGHASRLFSDFSILIASSLTDLALRVVEVFDRRLAVHAGEEQGGQQRGDALFDARFPGHARQIMILQRSEAFRQRRVRYPERLEDEVVQAEGDIEGRVAVPGALGVEEHRSPRGHEDVLRADVAVNQRHMRSSSTAYQSHQLLFEIGMLPGRRNEIGLETDGVEDLVGREAPGDLGVAGGGGVDAGEGGADFRGEGGIGIAAAQPLLPDRIVEILHGEEALRVVPRQHFRRASRQRGVRRLHPEPLIAVALDRRFPQLRHAQPRQRALYADLTV
jgi:hypothetical protein